MISAAVRRSSRKFPRCMMRCVPESAVVEHGTVAAGDVSFDGISNVGLCQATVCRRIRTAERSSQPEHLDILGARETEEVRQQQERRRQQDQDGGGCQRDRDRSTPPPTRSGADATPMSAVRASSSPGGVALDQPSRRARAESGSGAGCSGVCAVTARPWVATADNRPTGVRSPIGPAAPKPVRRYPEAPAKAGKSSNTRCPSFLSQTRSRPSAGIDPSRAAAVSSVARSSSQTFTVDHAAPGPAARQQRSAVGRLEGIPVVVGRSSAGQPMQPPDARNVAARGADCRRMRRHGVDPHLSAQHRIEADEQTATVRVPGVRDNGEGSVT